MSTIPSVLTGEVESVIPKTSRNGKEYHEAHLTVSRKKWDKENDCNVIVNEPVVLELWAKKHAETMNANVGNMVIVNFHLESSEWQGKWYTKPRVVTVKAIEPAAAPASDGLDFD